MQRTLSILALVGCALAAQPVSACRQLVRFPEHLVADAEARGLFYVVEVLSTHGEGYIGRVIQSFGGKLHSGESIVIRFANGEEAHAVCPISIVPGITYLLRAVESGPDLVISRFDWLNVPSTHDRFPTYVRDLAP